MSVADIRERRWRKDADPSRHDPREALHAALREIPEGEARHIIVCVSARDDDGATMTRFFQAGDYDCAGQIGLLTLSIRDIAESDCRG